MYCNTGYTLLGQVVAAVSGKSLREFTTENIFRPLGMSSTHFRDDHAEIVPNQALGYEPEGSHVRLGLTNFDTVGATSLLTTVEDLARWDQNKPRELKPQVRDLFGGDFHVRFVRDGRGGVTGLLAGTDRTRTSASAGSPPAPDLSRPASARQRGRRRARTTDLTGLQPDQAASPQLEPGTRSPATSPSASAARRSADIVRPEARTMALMRQASRLVALTVVFALVLFGSAGTPRWREGWAFLAVTAALTTAYVLVVARFHPDLAQERTAPPPDAKQWDKPLVAAVAIVGPLVTAATAGLDRRFGWTAPLPAPAKAAGLLVIALAGALTCFAVARNPFFSSLVRIQRDRGHTVVQAGPYAVVRHPGYAASLLHMLATPLALGALAAYVPVSVVVVLTFVRTRLEDRTLQDELEGYAAYAAHVRYRLVPGLW